ncbi:hypothetical protein [Streptomyces atroolivaceus]|uniref:hypothetical protein n=1 Tax=Streptomyces atroolivaceus TaxID=66869 RepID=UPI0020243F95|nr:hypothetical protein [Streptomyces atroolivaceus]
MSNIGRWSPDAIRAQYKEGAGAWAGAWFRGRDQHGCAERDSRSQDPLRFRREARELLAAIACTDPHATLDVPRPQGPATGGSLNGGPVTDLMGLVFGGGSIVAAAAQIWLARVPQRIIVVTRPDGATLRISSKEARVDDERAPDALANSAAFARCSWSRERRRNPSGPPVSQLGRGAGAGPVPQVLDRIEGRETTVAI